MAATDETVLPPEHSPAGDGSITLFLGLFLLILAFFILLVSISTIEKVKSTVVQDSLTSAFSTILPPVTSPTTLTALEGEILAGPQFQDEVRGLFETSLQVAKVEVVQPGRLMVVDIPADVLFLPGEATFQPTQQPLFDRIVASVSGAPPGLRFDMEFVIGVPYVKERDLPSAQTLEIARAGAFAREMATRGVPPQSIVVGVRRGDPKNVAIYFYVRSAEEVQLRLFDEGTPPPDAAPARPVAPPQPVGRALVPSSPAVPAPPSASAPVPLLPAAPTAPGL